ncbi:MAG: dTDP-4-dehydrorhamnose 3,5-epimerase [Spirochaetes bacterium]|nr:dTDP-4-dehydrorhamnose 3,5-epimerase [Spirochaetota bacterium]
MPFKFTNLDLEGLVLVEPMVFPDDRGFFMESYKKSDFAGHGIGFDFVQDNHSLSGKDVVRGLHYQHSPKSQGKLVRVVRGAAWDVAVDIRKNSPNFLKWMSIELSEDNKKMFYIPPGFAHGFLALTHEVHLLYKCTEGYDSSLDAGIRWNDPDIGVEWPVKNPIVSEKDKVLPFIKDAKLFE